ncbi:hypothetical protein AB5L52_42955 [Streptomyces sp. CG4]|uniref:hypothetical protein n=1 Tax=unclassified Streptomyces TaxID=2593676 RepID=UPI00331F09A0
MAHVVAQVGSSVVALGLARWRAARSSAHWAARQAAIATRYRRFPHRDALIAQVVVDGFGIVLNAARTAATSARTDPPAAVQAFLQSVVDSRDSWFCP